MSVHSRFSIHVVSLALHFFKHVEHWSLAPDLQDRWEAFVPDYGKQDSGHVLSLRWDLLLQTAVRERTPSTHSGDGPAELAPAQTKHVVSD